jgi:hypothetical protein
MYAFVYVFNEALQIQIQMQIRAPNLRNLTKQENLLSKPFNRSFSDLLTFRSDS